MRKVPLFLIFGILFLLAYPSDAQRPTPRTIPNQQSGKASNKAETDSYNVSLIFNDIKFENLIKILTDAANIKIVASPEAAKIPITIYLIDVPPLEGLNSICRAYNLWMKYDEATQIIHIQTLDEFRQSIKVVNQDVIEVMPILYPNAQDVAEAIRNLFTDRVVFTRADEMMGSYQKISNALNRMDLMAQRGTLEDMSSTTGSGSNRGGVNVVGIGFGNNYGSSGYGNGTGGYGGSYGWGNSSGYGGNYGSQANYQSMSQYQKSLTEMVTEEINKMQWERIKTISNNINKDGTTTMNLSDNPGIVYLSVFSENNSLMVRSADPQAIQQIKKIIEHLDKPAPQVLLEVKVLSVRVDDTNQRSLDFMFKTGDNKTVGGYNVTPSFIPNALSGGAGEDRAATFSAVGDNFEILLKLIKTDDHATILATPTLIVADNEASNLFSGTEATILEKAESYTTLISGSETGAVSWSITAPRRKIGTSLVFTPKIHADRSVTIRLLQEQSQVGNQRSIVYSASTDTSTSTQAFLSQDIDYKSITTTVMARDKSIAVIGGLISEGVLVRREKIPFLSDIPVLGEYLFTRLAEERTRNELLVVIRPYVLLAPGETDRISRPFMERISQHPSAVGDIPDLGVTFPEEIAKPRKINPNDPWLIRTYDRLNSWGVDDTTAPEVNRASSDYHNAMKSQNATQEENTIHDITEKALENDSTEKSK